MKTIKNCVSAIFIIMITLATFSSCEEDIWFDRYPSIEGEWRIVSVNGYNSKYHDGDLWCFYHNGDFEARGYKLYEEGFWDMHRNKVYISFDTYDPEIEAYVADFEGDYMILNVRDYGYDGNYTLRLIRDSYYSQQKEKSLSSTPLQ